MPTWKESQDENGNKSKKDKNVQARCKKKMEENTGWEMR